MIRTLHVIESMDLKQGGPPEVIRNLKKSLNKNRKTISVLRLNKLDFRMFLGFVIFPKAKSKLFKFLNKYDIVHTHSIWSLKVAFLVFFANSLGIKVIFSSHGYLDDWSMSHSIFKKRVFYMFILKKQFLRSNIFFSNIGEYEDSKSKFSFADKFVIPNGINSLVYEKELKKKNYKKKIVYFGRIHEKKGIEILLETIKELPKEYFQRYTFEITGPGEINYINKISKIIKDYNIEKFISMLSPKTGEDKIKYLQSSDVFLLPSYEEGDSIALKEAMSAENAVIISEQCRLELVKKEKAGFIIETKKDSLKKALLALDNCDLKKMGINSKNIIKKYFDNDHCANRVFKIYEDIHTGSFVSKDWI